MLSKNELTAKHPELAFGINRQLKLYNNMLLVQDSLKEFQTL